MHTEYLENIVIDGETENITYIEKIRPHLHSALTLTEDWVLKLHRLDARQDENDIINIDFSKFWLPTNNIYPSPQRLSQQPHVAAAIVLAISKYWYRARGEKTRHRRAAFLVTTLVKFFEYSWRNNRCNLGVWTQNDFDDLVVLLGTGGWDSALDINNRISYWLESAKKKEIELLLQSELGRNQTNVNTIRFQRSLSTNIASREPKKYLSVFQSILGNYDSHSIKQTKSYLSKVRLLQPSTSMIRQTLDGINYLFGLPENVGLNFFPYPTPHITSKKVGKPLQRTANLGSEHAGKLLNEAYKWIYEIGPHLTNLIEELCSSTILAHQSEKTQKGEYLLQVLEKSNHTRLLNNVLPAPLQGLDFSLGESNSMSTISVREALLLLFSACFLIIAIMNGRRKDEVAHRKFGIHKGFIKIVNEEFRLYEGVFYIEKTYTDYLEFYVNQSTKDATDLLEKIQTSFEKIDTTIAGIDYEKTPIRERTLFSYRRFSSLHGVSTKKCWFNFESREDGNSYAFLKLALKEDIHVRPYPHMFRRFYAIIFYYQYSNASLMALRDQLGHWNLQTTQIYVTDPIMRSEGERIHDVITKENFKKKKTFDFHLKAIQKELDIVSDEVLLETVITILTGEPQSGGYGKYIKSLFLRLSKKTDFSELSFNQKTKRVTEIVKARGHKPTPMPHGQCTAGTTKSTRLAHCKDKETGALLKENASYITCGKCPFHFINTGYFEHLKMDLRILSAQDLNLGTLEGIKKNKEVINLRRVIELHSQRFEFKNENYSDDKS